MLLVCCLLLGLTLAAGNDVSITDFAVPSAVKAGQNVELQCRYSVQGPVTGLFMVKWWLTKLGSGDKLALYQRIGNYQGQSFDPERVLVKADDSIEIVDIQPNYSGTYECNVNNIDEERRMQELIVYTPGTGPMLNITKGQNDTGDGDVLVTCEAEGVAPEPELVIVIGGEQITATESIVQNNSTGDWSIATNVTVPAMETATEVSCELFYKNSNIVHEAYMDKITFVNSGGEITSTEEVETTTEVLIEGPAPQNGNRVLRCSWLVVLAAAAKLLLH